MPKSRVLKQKGPGPGSLKIGGVIQENVQQIGRLLASTGFKLDKYQPHITGEREIKSLTKLVLLGRDPRGQRVVIKASNVAGEKKRIKLEREIRQELEKLSRILHNPSIPGELYFGEKEGFLFFVTTFINQPKIFVAHSLKEQFEMAKRAIESYEPIQVKDLQKIIGKKSVACPVFDAANYRSSLNKQINFIVKSYQDKELVRTLLAVRKLFNQNAALISKYCNHLTHTDFCPHNFRVLNKKIHLLDYNAINFANRFEGWARLANYMVIHNPALEGKVISHLKKSRTQEERECFKLLRLYKTVFLITYYVKISNQVTGQLLKLTKLRVNFWHNLLKKLLENKTLTKAELNEYLNQRDKLRSGEEKKRQCEFAVA